MVYAARRPSVVALVPPQLTARTISQKLVCTRPVREGRFNISAEVHNQKAIINCYGHGGSGFTTLFGSVQNALHLLTRTQLADKRVPIRVIGAGCIGLTAAIELARQGYKVNGITAKDQYDIASWRAAGYFGLVSIRTSLEEQASLTQMGIDTFLTYRQIERGEHPYIPARTLRYLPVYCSQDLESGVEEFEARGLIPPKQHVSLDFGQGIIHPGFVCYMTYFINTTTLMQQLTAEVKRLQIPVSLQEIHSFEEVSESLLFNCTGLGSRELTHDQTLIPVKGHLVTLTPDAGCEHMNYMLYAKITQDGEEERIYLFPKDVSVTEEQPQGIPCGGVLGGTFIPSRENLSQSQQKELDQRAFRRMLDRHSQFFYGQPFN